MRRLTIAVASSLVAGTALAQAPQLDATANSMVNTFRVKLDAAVLEAAVATAQHEAAQRQIAEWRKWFAEYCGPNPGCGPAPVAEAAPMKGETR